jgi:hypothetical protein
MGTDRQGKYDPLDGYRGRTEDAYELMEDEVRALHSLASSDVDLGLLQDVLKMDDLVGDLKNESSTLKRLCTFASVQIGEACAAWVQSSDPTSASIIALHRNARAARLLLDWVSEQMDVGAAAEEQIMLGDEDHG